MLCREFSLVHYEPGSTVAIPLTCRAWNCDYCAPGRRRDLIDMAVAGNPNKLITLTVSPRLYGSPAARAKELANAWRLCVKRAKRAFGWKSLEYLAVFERTKRGEPHLHILARCGFIPQKWLSAQMRDLIGAPIVDIRQVKHAKTAAKYIAKYIGKDPHRFATCKRYWHTHGWVIGSPEEEQSKPWDNWLWTITEKSTTAIAKEWGDEGITIDFEGNFDTVWKGRPPPWVAARGAPPPGGKSPGHRDLDELAQVVDPATSAGAGQA